MLGNEEEYTREDLEDEETALMIAATGMTLVREKTCKLRKIHKWILSGGGVLEDSGYISPDRISPLCRSMASGGSWITGNGSWAR